MRLTSWGLSCIGPWTRWCRKQSWFGFIEGSVGGCWAWFITKWGEIIFLAPGSSQSDSESQTSWTKNTAPAYPNTSVSGYVQIRLPYTSPQPKVYQNSWVSVTLQGRQNCDDSQYTWWWCRISVIKSWGRSPCGLGLWWGWVVARFMTVFFVTWVVFYRWRLLTSPRACNTAIPRPPPTALSPLPAPCPLDTPYNLSHESNAVPCRPPTQTYRVPKRLLYWGPNSVPRPLQHSQMFRLFFSWFEGFIVR